MNEELHAMPLPPQPAPRWEGWAVVEQMGHIRVIGYVTDADYFGVRFAHVETPAVGDQSARTRNVAGTTIFAFSPTDKAEILAELERDWQQRVQQRLREEQYRREAEERDARYQARLLSDREPSESPLATAQRVMRDWERAAPDPLPDMDDVPFSAGPVITEEDEDSRDGIADGMAYPDVDGYDPNAPPLFDPRTPAWDRHRGVDQQVTDPGPITPVPQEVLERIAAGGTDEGEGPRGEY